MVGVDVRFLDFAERLNSGIEELRQRWHKRLAAEDLCVSEAYIQGAVELLLVFEVQVPWNGHLHLAARFKASPVIPGIRPFREGRKYYRNGVRDGSVLVLPVDFVQGPKGKIPSWCRFDFINKERPKPTEAKFYRSVIDKLIKPLIFSRNREVDILNIAFGGSLFSTHCGHSIIQASPEAADDFSGHYPEREGEQFRLCDEHLRKIGLVSIEHFDGDGDVVLDVVCEEGVKLVDAMFGPYGISPSVMKDRESDYADV